jgi:hypothetical protein
MDEELVRCFIFITALFGMFIGASALLDLIPLICTR